MEKVGDIVFWVGLEKLRKESTISTINSKGDLVSFGGNESL